MDIIQATRIINLILSVIGVLICIAAATKVRLLFNLFDFQSFWQQAIVSIYFASAIIAFIGLLRLRIWGFIAACIHILVATLGLSISVWPFLFNMLRLNHRSANIVLLIGNLLMLFLIIGLLGAKKTLHKGR